MKLPSAPDKPRKTAPGDVQPQVDRYRPTSRRQRLVIIAVALATAVVLWLLLLYRPGGNPYRYMPAPPAPCAAGQTSGCVGGQANVLLLPAAPASGATGASRSTP